MYFDVKCDFEDFDKYFSVIGAINYLCSKTNAPAFEIAQYILNNNYVFKLKSYRKKSLAGHYEIFEMIEDRVKVDKLSAINYLLENIDDYPANKKIEYFSYPERVTYWEKNDFLNLPETIDLFQQDQQLNKKFQNLKHPPNFKNLLKINDPYISVFNIFETIKNKTDLKSDQEIAHFLQTIDITKKSTPFSKAEYFLGKPVELFRDYQNKTLTKMDLLLIELSSGEICINSNDLRLKNFVFDKFDFFFEFRDITNFDLDSEDVDQVDSFEQTQQNNEIPLFYLNDTFSLIEAACVLSGDNSIQMNRCFNDTNFEQNYPEFNEAYSFICSAVQAGRFAGDLILANDLKSYLRSKGKIIDGFNDQLKNEVTEQNLDNQNSIIDQLKKENERLKQLLQKNEGESVELAIDLKASENTLNRITTKNEELKAELLEKDEKIKELELIQTTPDESKLGNTRAENNVTKLLLVLAKMANIDINKPHAVHDSLLVQAELLGVDKFPSDETIKKWLIKANRHGNNLNPN